MLGTDCDLNGLNCWSEGAAPIGYETDPTPIPIRTQTAPTVTANPFVRTYYFQVTFNVDDPLVVTTLLLRHEIDDGAVFYLNGFEIDGTRYNMAGNTGEPVLSSTPATIAVGNATLLGPFALSASLLRQGENVLSVEVHQVSPSNSSDVVFGVELQAGVELTPLIPGTPFEEDPLEWIEVYNRGATPVNLDNWCVKEAIQYQFPSGTTLRRGNT